MIGEVLALAGALLTLLAAIGVVRFRDVLERMHAVTKASTVGLLFVLVGTAFARARRRHHDAGARRRARRW